MSAWQHLVSHFRSLQAERQSNLASQTEREAAQAEFDAWAASASRAAVRAVAETLGSRVPVIRRASGCDIQLLPAVAASAGGYAVDSVRLTLPPCHVDIYAARCSGELPRIHFAITTLHQRHRGRMLSLPGCTIVPGLESGFHLRGDDGRGTSSQVTVEQLALKALDLLAGSCRSLGYARGGPRSARAR